LYKVNQLLFAINEEGGEESFRESKIKTQKAKPDIKYPSVRLQQSEKEENKIKAENFQKGLYIIKHLRTNSAVTNPSSKKNKRIKRLSMTGPILTRTFPSPYTPITIYNNDRLIYLIFGHRFWVLSFSPF